MLKMDCEGAHSVYGNCMAILASMIRYCSMTYQKAGTTIVNSRVSFGYARVSMGGGACDTATRTKVVIQ